MSRLISRGPFAREEIHRSRDYGIPASMGCAWCGQMPKTKAGKVYLYAYTVETDGGKHIPIMGRYCSESCRKAFN